MGNRYEVYKWEFHTLLQEWRYEEVYCGQSFVKAMWNMWQAKRNGTGCVKLEWR